MNFYKFYRIIRLSTKKPTFYTIIKEKGMNFYNKYFLLIFIVNATKKL